MISLKAEAASKLLFRNPSAYQRLCVARKAQPTVNHIRENNKTGEMFPRRFGDA